MTNIATPIIDRIKELTGSYEADVPIVDIANQLQIAVFPTEGLKGSESGLIRKEGEKYIIYVNKNHPYTRQRFTIAHELGHFLAHRDQLDKGVSFVDHAKTGSEPVCELRRVEGAAHTQEEKQREREADCIAALLLMPEENFRRAWHNSSTIEEVAERLKVSAAAATIRSKEVLGHFAV